MIERINGDSYKGMIDYGARNLSKHCKAINELNVFPVPDGDTGTNMVTTVVKGLRSIENSLTDLSAVSKKFADSVIYGARGNSGVIISQFLKGISESFIGVDTADAELFVKALERGVECAHEAVATPVEGTMLTVVKDATLSLKLYDLRGKSIDEVVDLFIARAKISLENTPELLPALKEAGVVDSGGAGIVYFFEGMKKYLDGEELETFETEGEGAAVVDYTVFNADSVFEYGYCTELLLQLLNTKEKFDFEAFKCKLNSMGDSVVVSLEKDKVKLHVHTMAPEEVFSECHRYGEFLSLKIENMTVQHTETVKNIVCSPTASTGKFSVVAVAYDRSVQELFIEMGADVVIYSDDSATTKDYIDAFENVETEEILVFPNSSDSMLAALQAKKIYKKASVSVLTSRSIAECYAALPIVNFEETDTGRVIDQVAETINQLSVVSVAKRKNPIDYCGNSIRRNEFYAFSGKEIISIGNNLVNTVVDTIDKTLKNDSKGIITVFHGASVTDEQIDAIIIAIEELGICAEVYAVHSKNSSCEMTISFE